MAEISLIRVDQRMVHGQVCVKWSKVSKATKIICVDDEAAGNELVKKMFKLAAPIWTKVIVYSVDRCIEKWNECKFNDGVVLIIFKNISTCYRAYESGFPISKLQLGNIPKVADSVKRLGNEVAVTQRELDCLTKMANSGVKIEIQTIPEQNVTSFK